MVILWRVLLAVSLALLGLATGTFIGTQFFMAEGQGLAAAPIALGYGLIGAIVLTIIALIAGIKLPMTRVRSLALLGFTGVVLIYGALFYRAMAKSMATREPDNAFATIGDFTAIMERLDLSDPFLFVKMEVNSNSRQWTLTGPAPAHQVCTAKMKAKPLADLHVALENLTTMSAEDLATCRTAQGPAIKRLHWKVKGRSGQLNISATCVQNHYPVARALALIESASRTSASKVKCK